MLVVVAATLSLAIDVDTEACDLDETAAAIMEEALARADEMLELAAKLDRLDLAELAIEPYILDKETDVGIVVAEALLAIALDEYALESDAIDDEIAPGVLYDLAPRLALSAAAMIGLNMTYIF